MGPNAASSLPSTAPADRWFSQGALRTDGARSAGARSHDLVPPWPVPRYSRYGAGLHLIIDSSGLSIVGAGEWATAQHGRRGRRGWKKLHLGVDPIGVIVAHALTEATLDDATTGVELIAAVNDDITRITGDAAYDTVASYDTASVRGATVVVPPAKTASVSPRGPRSSVRDRTINTVKRIGRCRWKKTSRYQQQARVENAFFRYQSIIGDGPRAKTPGGRTAETLLACNILNTDDRHGPGRKFALSKAQVRLPQATMDSVRQADPVSMTRLMKGPRVMPPTCCGSGYQTPPANY